MHILYTPPVSSFRYISLEVSPYPRQVHSSLLNYASRHEDVWPETGGQPHAPDALTPGEAPLPTVQECRWAPVPVWKQNFCPCRESNRIPGRLATILTSATSTPPLGSILGHVY